MQQYCLPVPVTMGLFIYCIYFHCWFTRNLLCFTENVLLLALSLSYMHTEPLTGKEIKGKPFSLSKCCLEQPNLAESRTCSPLSSVTLHIQLAFSEVKTRQDPGYQQLGFLTHW